MDIERSGGKPLTAEQQALLDLFRSKVDEVIKYRGLSESDVKRLVKEVRAHPDCGPEILATVFAELSERMPGSRLSYDWD
jgi:hypothetical protein